MSAKSTHLFRRGSCPMLILWVPLHFVTSKRHFITLSLELWFGTLLKTFQLQKNEKTPFQIVARFIACVMWHVYRCGLLDDSWLALSKYHKYPKLLISSRPQAVPLCHTGFGEVVTSTRSFLSCEAREKWCLRLPGWWFTSLGRSHSTTRNLYVC